MTYDSISVAFQSTRPALSEKERGKQWINDVKAVIRAFRSRDPQTFDPERFLTLTGYNDECQKAWDIR